MVGMADGDYKRQDDLIQAFKEGRTSAKSLHEAHARMTAHERRTFFTLLIEHLRPEDEDTRTCQGDATTGDRVTAATSPAVQMWTPAGRLYLLAIGEGGEHLSFPVVGMESRTSGNGHVEHLPIVMAHKGHEFFAVGPDTRNAWPIHRVVDLSLLGAAPRLDDDLLVLFAGVYGVMEQELRVMGYDPVLERRTTGRTERQARGGQRAA